MARLDHVLFGVTDLDAAAARLWEKHGLESIFGGTHPEWGTANRIVPLGDQYIELIAVDDPASTHPIVKFVSAMTARGDRPIGLALEVDDIEVTAARLGAAVLPGHRTTPDGDELVWRMTGIEAALTEHLPFFIRWDEGRDVRMGRSTTRQASGVHRVDVGGDEQRLRDWTCGDVDGLRPVGGEPGMHGFEIATDDGVLRIA